MICTSAVEEILGRKVYCVIYIMLLPCQGWVKPCSVEELVKSGFEDMIVLKKRLIM